jgi:hypothetical protein
MSACIPIWEMGWAYDIGVKDNLGDQVIGANEDIESMLKVIPEYYFHQPLPYGEGRTILPLFPPDACPPHILSILSSSFTNFRNGDPKSRRIS